MAVITTVADGTISNADSDEIRALAKATIRLDITTKYDNLLDQYIQQVVGFFEEDNGELLTQRVVTEKHTSINAGDLSPKYAPIVAVTKFGTYSYTGDISNAPADTDFFTADKTNIFVKRGTCPQSATGKVTVEYTAGFAALSADYKAGIASAVALLFESGGTDLVNTMGYRKRFIVC